MQPIKKFKVTTLGCRTNQYESEAYMTQLKTMGYCEASETEAADVCIVNTCTVTESADSHSRHEIRKIARANPGAKLVVTGCLAERLPKEIGAIEGVTHVISNAGKERLLESIFPEEDLPEFKIDQFSGHTRAFVKVQDGCNSFCTYCIIPYVRGKSRSRPVKEIVQEIEGLITSGYKEIVLTGINIGDYRGDKGELLSDLIQIVDGISGLERIRVSSIDPDEIDNRLSQVILEGSHTCHSMHIVLQSGSNVILKRMNRKYTRQIFLETVERLKNASPDFTFTTDIIVGFPGETEKDFQETLEVMQEVKFAKVHMFPYSERKRTRAALFPNKMSQKVIQERKQVVLRKAERDAFELRQKYVGRKMKVLTEEGRAGHTENFLNVVFPQEMPRNEIIEVFFNFNTPYGLTGSIS